MAVVFILGLLIVGLVYVDLNTTNSCVAWIHHNFSVPSNVRIIRIAGMCAALVPLFAWFPGSLGNGRVSRVEGHTSRVEGHRSRFESRGRGSKVEVEGQKSRSRVKSRGSKMRNINFLLIIFRILHFWHLLSKC
jgi:hypothetical protein